MQQRLTLSEWLRRRVERASLRRVAREMRVAEATVLRVLAGLDVHLGTLTLLEQGRERIEARQRERAGVPGVAALADMRGRIF